MRIPIRQAAMLLPLCASLAAQAQAPEAAKSQEAEPAETQMMAQEPAEAQEQERYTAEELQRSRMWHKATFPGLTLINVQAEEIFKNDYGAKRRGYTMEKGQMEQQRLKANANIPLYMGKKLIVSATVRYRLENFSTSDRESCLSDSLMLPHPDEMTTHYFQGALRVTYNTVLWGKKTLITASINADGSSHKFWERVNGDAMILFTLKDDAASNVGLGLVCNTTPTSILPAIPVLSLSKQFSPRWRGDLLFPQHGYIRMQTCKKARLSAGLKYVNDYAFVYPEDVNLPRGGVYGYNRNEIRTELVYEHSLAPGLVANVQAGLITDFWCKYRPNNIKRSFVYTWHEPIMQPMVSCGISYMPQLKKKDKKPAE